MIISLLAVIPISYIILSILFSLINNTISFQERYKVPTNKQLKEIKRQV